jgi:hypothetical protein
VTSALLLVVALAANAAAADAPGFRHARPVMPGAAGPNRLPVDVGLLTGARALRFDASGALVGGLVRVLRIDEPRNAA